MSMLEEFEERINNAKNKQFKIFERFHIGDSVYPFWLHGLVVYGTVTDIDTVARKIYCDFNGVTRQFQPEDLMHVNPEIVNAETLKRRNASARKIDRKEYGFYVVLGDGSIESGWEYREDANDRRKELADESIPSKVMTRRSLGDKPLDNANWHKGAITASAKDKDKDKSDKSEDGTYSKFSETHLSPDTDNGIRATCKKCGGEIAVAYDGQHVKADFVCTKCGMRISEDELSSKTKKAMWLSQQKNLSASLRTAGESVSTADELADLLKRTIVDVDNGRHCWCKLPSGNWFCTEDADEDGKGVLHCYINTEADALGYPSGEMLCDVGTVEGEADAQALADYAFECDAEISDGGVTASRKMIGKELARIAKELIKRK